MELLTTRDVIGAIYLALEKAKLASWVGRISTLFPSNQDVETYVMAGMTPVLGKWVGERRGKSLSVNNIQITNVEYDASLAILLKHFRRDKTGQVNQRIEELAVRAIQHWASLLTTVIINGESSACYDGEYFFDDDHPIGDTGSTQKNDLAAGDYPVLNVATPTAPTAAEMAEAILAVIQHLYTLKDDQNEPINESAMDFTVMVPVPFWGATIKAITSNLLNSGSGSYDNALDALRRGGFNITPVANPRLNWTTKFAVFINDGTSLIRQAEDLNGGGQSTNVPSPSQGLPESFGVKLTDLGPESEHAKLHKEVLFNIDANRGVNYGLY